MHYYLLVILLMLVSISPLKVNAYELSVLATIKPIHSLLSSIAGDAARVELLIQDDSSPHHYSPKFSDMKKLGKADIILAVDPALERFLASNKSTVYLSDSVQKLPKRGGKNAGYDIHIWLSPSNAIIIIDHITKVLVEHDPTNKHIYEENCANTKLLLLSLIEKNRARLKSVGNINYLVFHDAYQYFENEFNLKGAIVKRHSHLSISDLEQIKRNGGIQCVIEEPSEDFDPLGRAIPASKHMYFLLIDKIAKAFETCMKC